MHTGTVLRPQHILRGAAALLWVLAGCDAGPAGTDTGPHDATNDMHMSDGPRVDAPAADAPRPDDVLSLAIEPGTTALTSTDGSTPTATFQLFAVRRDGSRAAIAALSWTLADARFGAISPAGVFTASGLAAGTVSVTATAPGAGGLTLSAMAAVTVTVERTVLDTGAPADAATRFSGASTSPPTFSIVYPLENALMPNNVYPPTVQWTGATAGNLSRVRITTPHLTITAFTVSPTASWLVDATAWRTLAASDGGAPITIQVDQTASAGGAVIATAPVHMRLARGAIYGDVYYWNVGAGLRRINAATAHFENFMPSPPTGCIACHAISHDGRYLAGILEGSASIYSIGVFDLTRDLSGSPAPTLFAPPTQASAWAAFTPDGLHIISAGFGSIDMYSQAGFALFNARTGARETPVAMPASPNVTHPEFSPDGQSLVFVDDVSGAYPSTPGGIHFTSSSLYVSSVSGTDTLTFGAPRLLHTGSDLSGGAPAGSADARPVFSPDSRLVVFQHGACAYGQYVCPNALYVVPAAGGATVRLDNANGGATGASAYWPSFSPYVTREPSEEAGTSPYAWVAFYSRRDYGNAAAGAHGRRQLWVSAIRLDAAVGTDPSFVPYWLPGQNPASENAGGQWAPVPCRANGSDCATSAECCSGVCAGPGPMTCQPPPMTQCRAEGQQCGGTEDCCGGLGLVCFGNICGLPPG